MKFKKILATTLIVVTIVSTNNIAFADTTTTTDTTTEVTASPTPTPTNSLVLKYSDKYRTIAQVGDTFIDKKGKKTKLITLKYKSKELEGCIQEYEFVVGYGQKLDLFSGMEFGDGVFKPGDTGIDWYGDAIYLGDTYLVASNGEGHFISD